MSVAVLARPGLDPALRRRRRTRRLIAAAAALVTLATAGWVIGFSSVFAVEHVTITGARRVSAERVLAQAAVPIGRSLVRVDTGRIGARVANLGPVASVRVERRYPATVRIQVTERVATAVALTPRGRLLVDSRGVAFAPADSSAARLPEIRSDAARPAPRALSLATTVLRVLPRTVRARVREVRADGPEEVSLRLGRDLRVVWGGPGQAAFKAEVLAAVLAGEAPTSGGTTIDVSVPEAPVIRS